MCNGLFCHGLSAHRTSSVLGDNNDGYLRPMCAHHHHGVVTNFTTTAEEHHETGVYLTINDDALPQRKENAQAQSTSGAIERT